MQNYAMNYYDVKYNDEVVHSGGRLHMQVFIGSCFSTIPLIQMRFVASHRLSQTNNSIVALDVGPLNVTDILMA